MLLRCCFFCIGSRDINPKLPGRCADTGKNWHLKRLLKKASLSGTCSGGFKLKQILRQIIAKRTVTNPHFGGRPTILPRNTQSEANKFNKDPRLCSAESLLDWFGVLSCRLGKRGKLKIGLNPGPRSEDSQRYSDTKIKCLILLFTLTIYLPDHVFLNCLTRGRRRHTVYAFLLRQLLAAFLALCQILADQV